MFLLCHIHQNCLNIKKLHGWNRHDIRNLSDSNESGTLNNLVRNGRLNYKNSQKKVRKASKIAKKASLVMITNKIIKWKYFRCKSGYINLWISKKLSITFSIPWTFLFGLLVGEIPWAHACLYICSSFRWYIYDQFFLEFVFTFPQKFSINQSRNKKW